MKSLNYLSLLIFSLACSLTTPPAAPQVVPAQLSNNPPLATPTPDPGPSSHTIPATCTVSAQSLHLRECAGMHCPVADWLSNGDVLEVLDTDQDWLNVITPAGKNGWVHSKYCGGTQ